MVMINILKEPRDKKYRDLLDMCLHYASSFILVIRDEMEVDEKCLAKNKELSIFLSDKKRTSEWPGI